MKKNYDYFDVVDLVREKFSGADVSQIPVKLAFQFNITGRVHGIFYVEIKNGELHVEPYDYHDNDAVIHIKTTDLIKILEGKMRAVNAFSNGKIQVDGDTGKALELLRFFRQDILD